MSRWQHSRKIGGEQFGSGVVLNPANLIDSSRFEIKTPEITISADPEYSYLVETQIINGRKYLLILLKMAWRSTVLLSALQLHRKTIKFQKPDTTQGGIIFKADVVCYFLS